MADVSKREQERLDSLKSIREESLKLGDSPEGKQLRAVTMTFACMLIVAVGLLLYDLVTGRGVCDIMAIPLAAFTGLAWYQYRETKEREMGWYAVASGVLTAIMIGLHVCGIF